MISLRLYLKWQTCLGFEDCTKDAVVEMVITSINANVLHNAMFFDQAEDITNLTRQVEDFFNDLQVQQSRNTSLAEKLKITKDMIKTMVPKTDYYQLLVTIKISGQFLTKFQIRKRRMNRKKHCVRMKLPSKTKKMRSGNEIGLWGPWSGND